MPLTQHSVFSLSCHRAPFGSHSRVIRLSFTCYWASRILKPETCFNGFAVSGLPRRGHFFRAQSRKRRSALSPGFLAQKTSKFHIRCVKKVRGGLFPKGRKSESHCIDTAVRSLTERLNSSRRSPRSKPMFSLPVPERIEGAGSVPRGVEFCVAFFGKETPTDQLVVIASIRRLHSYQISLNFATPHFMD